MAAFHFPLLLQLLSPSPTTLVKHGRSRIGNAIGPYEDQTSAKRRKLKWYGTSHDHLDWPRLSNREQFKEGDEEADRGNNGKTTSKNGLALNEIYYYGKPRIARSGGSRL